MGIFKGLDEKLSKRAQEAFEQGRQVWVVGLGVAVSDGAATTDSWSTAIDAVEAEGFRFEQLVPMAGSPANIGKNNNPLMYAVFRRR